MLGEISAILAAVFWSFTAILYKKGISFLSALPAVLVRSFIGMIFFLVVYLFIRGAEFSVPLIALFYLILGGIFRLVLGDLAYLKSLEFAAVSRVVPIVFTFPLFTILLSMEILKEEIHLSVIVGSVLIVVGIWILSNKKDSISMEKDAKKGVIFSLLAAILYSFSIITTKIGLINVDPFLANFIRMPIPVLIFYLAYSFEEGPKAIFEHNSKSYVLLGLAGITGLGIGTYFFLFSLAQISTSHATSLSSTTPLFSSLFAFIFLKERFTLRLLSGILTIFIGICIITLLN